MSSDGVSRINFLRNLYQSKETGSSSEEVRELTQIKNELKISNDERVRENKQITNASSSPYLPDQQFYRKEVVYNSTEETSWREVKTEEQSQQEARTTYLRRKLNII